MKKNRTLKLASGLLILCLITTCAISTTLAKYTTGTTASDTARVAKWGVEVSTSGTMFGKAYKDLIVDWDDVSATVQTFDEATGGKVVAPGTKNDVGIEIKIDGTPEVDFQVVATGAVHNEIYLEAGEYGVMVEAYGVNIATDFAAEKLYTESAGVYTRATAFDGAATYYRLNNYVDVTARYNPIVWTGEVHSAGTTGESIGSWAQEFTTLTEAVNALKNQINTIGKTNDGIFDANETIRNTYRLKWSWSYENSILAYADGADTILGDLIAGNAKVVKISGNTATAPVEGTDYQLIIVCGIGVTVTQID